MNDANIQQPETQSNPPIDSRVFCCDCRYLTEKLYCKRKSDERPAPYVPRNCKEFSLALVFTAIPPPCDPICVVPKNVLDSYTYGFHPGDEDWISQKASGLSSDSEKVASVLQEYADRFRIAYKSDDAQEGARESYARRIANQWLLALSKAPKNEETVKILNHKPVFSEDYRPASDSRIAAVVKKRYVPPEPYVRSVFPDSIVIPPLDESTEPTLLECHPEFGTLWDKRRAEVSQISEIYAQSRDHQKLAKRLDECCSLLRFDEEGIDSDGVILHSLGNTFSCGARHCPVCSSSRSRRNSRTALARLPAIEDANPGLEWLLLTLTVKDPPMNVLANTLTDMNKAWGRLTKRKCWPASGWARTTEVTRDKNGNPHPHFHVIMCVPKTYWLPGKYINGGRWLKLWRQAMRDTSITQVDIRKIGERSTPSWYVPEKDETPQRRALKYTLKYATKTADLVTHPEFLYGITDELRGKRFLSSGGILKGLFRRDRPEMSDEDKDELMRIAYEADILVTSLAAATLAAEETKTANLVDDVEHAKEQLMTYDQASADAEAAFAAQINEKLASSGLTYEPTIHKEKFTLHDDKNEYFGPPLRDDTPYLLHRKSLSVLIEHLATCDALSMVVRDKASAVRVAIPTLASCYPPPPSASPFSDTEAVAIRDALADRYMIEQIVERAHRKTLHYYRAYRRLLVGSEVQQIMLAREALKRENEEKRRHLFFEWRHNQRIYRRCKKRVVLQEEGIFQRDGRRVFIPAADYDEEWNRVKESRGTPQLPLSIEDRSACVPFYCSENGNVLSDYDDNWDGKYSIEYPPDDEWEGDCFI